MHYCMFSCFYRFWVYTCWKYTRLSTILNLRTTIFRRVLYIKKSNVILMLKFLQCKTSVSLEMKSQHNPKFIIIIILNYCTIYKHLLPKLSKWLLASIASVLQKFDLRSDIRVSIIMAIFQYSILKCKNYLQVWIILSQHLQF